MATANIPPKRRANSPIFGDFSHKFYRKIVSPTLKYNAGWVWSKRYRSRDVFVTRPYRTAYFHPNWSLRTAGVRGTHAINGCRHFWEIQVNHRLFGTSMMFGVGTADVRLESKNFENLLGEDGNGWGLNHKGCLWHNGLAYIYTKMFVEEVPATIGVYFDGLGGTLTYYKDGKCLGVAFHDLHKIKKPLYPIVISTAAKSQMFISKARRDFPSLQDRCRSEILKHVENESDIKSLELPFIVTNYLLDGFYKYGTVHKKLKPIDDYDDYVLNL